MSSSLQAIDLACRRGRRMLFEGFNLEARPGDLIWIRGPNGCGKTSLLRLATGLSTPERGEVLWNRKPVWRAQCYLDSLVFVGHTNALKEDLSVGEALSFLLQMHGRPHEANRVHLSLDRFGLLSRRDAMVRTLSQGQRRRVALARLLCEAQSPVWVLDEPFDGLDAEGSDVFSVVLEEQLLRGGTILLTSHQAIANPRLRPLEINLNRYA